MKSIIVHLENTVPIEMLDDDETPLNEYTDKLASVFQLSNVSILKTSHSAVLIRPNQLTGIKVSEETTNVEKVECEPQESEDIITDAN